ncbi:acetoacetate decarboxylase family protein [Geitlerinema sp. PCC 9228]|uniref:acetoacetate decarboxylase family protein n=1 Tax=Geitlerinema sp. PCC 9228 TaxID=111611 RepID=UPI0008F9AA3E|nr:acetoacetate decarboxylase family protein [Geitlerinema sp. PCC 9228]
MAYPKSPWTLKGFVVGTLHWIDSAAVRSLLPSECQIVEILPGKTLASVYLAKYEAGSALSYSELIVAPSLVRHGGKAGGWISYIYVDHPDSVAGGREIWGLPKEMAEFTWEKGNPSQVTVRQEGTTLLRLEYRRSLGYLPLRAQLYGYSILEPALLRFAIRMRGWMGGTGSRLEIPEESPLATLPLSRGKLTYRCPMAQLTVSAPESVGISQFIRKQAIAL